MTSKEALDELRNVLNTNQGTKGYVDIFENHLLKPIEKDLEVLSILKKKLNTYDLSLTFKNNTLSANEFNKVNEWLENED